MAMRHEKSPEHQCVQGWPLTRSAAKAMGLSSALGEGHKHSNKRTPKVKRVSGMKLGVVHVR